MSHWTRYFSFPHRDCDDLIFDTVAITHARAITTWIVTTFAAEIAGSANGLLEYLVGWTETTPAFATVWDLAFARAQLVLKAGYKSCGPIPVQLGLRVAESGYQGEWVAHMSPCSLRIGNLFISSVVRAHVVVREDSAIIALLTANGVQLTARRDSNSSEWECDGAEGLPSAGTSGPVYLVSNPVINDDTFVPRPFEDVRAVESLDGEEVSCFRAGMAALQRYAPEYVPWVERVLHNILVCGHEQGYRVVSGSAEDAPGMVHMTFPLSSMEIAEIVVHESAHQFYYLLQRVGPLDDGTDQQLYWSPPIRRNRPLSRILMAYHALANVRFLYDSVDVDKGADKAYVDANLAELDQFLAVLDVPLRGNRALTELGHGLYEPLARRLAHPCFGVGRKR